MVGEDGMFADAPPLDRDIEPIRPADTQFDTRIDADPSLNLWGDMAGDRRWAGDTDVPPPGMQGMYYLG